MVQGDCCLSTKLSKRHLSYPGIEELGWTAQLGFKAVTSGRSEEGKGRVVRDQLGISMEGTKHELPVQWWESFRNIGAKIWSGAGGGRGRAARMLAHGPNHNAGLGAAVLWTSVIWKWRGGGMSCWDETSCPARSTGTCCFWWLALLASKSGKKWLMRVLTRSLS